MTSYVLINQSHKHIIGVFNDEDKVRKLIDKLNREDIIIKLKKMKEQLIGEKDIKKKEDLYLIYNNLYTFFEYTKDKLIDHYYIDQTSYQPYIYNCYKTNEYDEFRFNLLY